MKSSQKAYPRNIQYNSGSLMITIPSTIAHKFELKKGQMVMVGYSNDLIIIKPTDVKLAKKDLRVSLADILEEKPESEESKDNSKPKYDNPLDDPDFNPLDRLEIK